MPKTRPKAPTETKTDLMREVVDQLRGSEPESAILYLLNFFTAIDLIGIRDDLKRRP